MEVIRMPVSRELVSGSERTIGSRLQLADPALTENMVQAGFEWLCIEARGIVAPAVNTASEAEAIVAASYHRRGLSGCRTGASPRPRTNV